MAYNIEVLIIKEELLSNAQEACNSLNKVQSEFQFEIPEKKYREKLYIYQRESYATSEITKWLKTYKETVKGFRPFIILIVDGFLSSERWQNIFGNIERSENIAVFTTYQFNQFIKDQISYCKYYLMRYAINFLAKTQMSHNLDHNKDCIFHFKENKKDLLLSLNSGRICDNCRSKLQSEFNEDIYDAINKMLLIVSNRHPYSIIMKGGGVKGLAFAGALLELEKYYSFDTFAGTSAGAIAAVLLGAGYKPEELLKILEEKNFKDFKDKSIFSILYNLLTRKGLYPGNSIKSWINDLLIKKYPNKLNDIQLRDLENRTIVYASRKKNGTLVFDSKGNRNETNASFAARCSMSIPFYFEPQYIDGIKVYDGGLRNNFPLTRFIDDNRNNPFIGLYLKSSDTKCMLRELLNIAIDGEEMELVEANLDKVVVIDVSLISTTNFNLSNLHKKYLVLSGRISALKFIEKNFPDFDLDKTYLSSLENELEETVSLIN